MLKKIIGNAKTIALGKTPEHILGQIYIQETAASLPASIIPLPAE